MATITLKRNKDYMITFRALKIYVNDTFIDYFEPDEKEKEILVEEGSEVKVKVDWCSSNIIKISKNKGLNTSEKQSYNISSQIHNGLFILIFGSFFLGGILKLFDVISPYMYIALTSPLSIIVGWQIFGRNKYLRLSKSS